MSLLIKGMKMPAFCAVCDIADWEYDCCPVADRKNIRITDTSGRPDFCPLIELSDHGDLMDKDKFYIDLMDRGVDHVQTDDYTEICQAVYNAPVVIPAERSE